MAQSKSEPATPIAQCQAHELKGLLTTIAHQLADVDRRHGEALQSLNDRMSGFAPGTSGMHDGMAAPESDFANEHADVPHPAVTGSAEVAPPFEGPVSRMPNGRMPPAAEAPMALRSALGDDAKSWPRKDDAASRSVDTFDVIESSMPGDVSNPWDDQSADALANLYNPHEVPAMGAAETFAPMNEPAAAPGMPSAMPAMMAASGGFDHSWIENQFAQMSKRLDQSFAENNVDQSLFALSQRVEQVERSIASVLDTVATRGDVEGLRIVEAHVGEIVEQMTSANDRLSHLDMLESQFSAISAQLDELANIHREAPAYSAPAFDADQVALKTAAAVAAEFRAQWPQPQARTDNETAGLIERFMSESRQGNEHLSALLDTLQQAMIRVLDRVDAIEMHQVQSVSALSLNPGVRMQDQAFEPQPVPDEPAFDDMRLTRKRAEWTVSADQDRMEIQPDVQHQMDAPADSPDKMRQDFIAKARRAKMRVANDAAEAPASAPVERAMRMPPAKALESMDESVKVRSSRKPADKGSQIRPRIMVIGLGAIAAIMAGVLAWKNLYSDQVASEAMPIAPVATQSAAPAESAVQTQEPQNAEPPAEAGSTETPPDTPDQAPEPEQQDPDFKNQQGTTGEIVPGDPSIASLPGVSLGSNGKVSAADILRARSQQAIAVTSEKIGKLAGVAGQAAVPAALTPDDLLAQQNSGTETRAANVKNHLGYSTPADLPDVTVGPLSLRLAAANGDPSAQFEVGARLAEGKGTAQNFAEAAKWYQRSADSGFIQSQYRLGTFYERGLGVKADPAKAQAWYLKAAELGNVKAMHNLAVLSANQNKASPDYATAAKWFASAADFGLADSQFNLAVLYENGLGLQQDVKAAYKWLSISARSGDPEAIKRRDILKGKLTAADLSLAEGLIKQWQQKRPNALANDARVAGEAWKKNPANGTSG